MVQLQLLLLAALAGLCGGFRLGPARLVAGLAPLRDAASSPNPDLNPNTSPVATSSVPSPFRINIGRGLLQGGVALVGGLVISQNMPGTMRASGGRYPIRGDESIMSAKKHGTSDNPVQQNLRYGVDRDLADRICNYNRHWAENFGYWQSTTLFSSLRSMGDGSSAALPISFYDSVTGVELFRAPVGRSLKEWVDESISHGWPSFRDEEVLWENVRCLGDGETVSLSGTHLGHNLGDRKGNRYCINLVSISGSPV